MCSVLRYKVTKAASEKKNKALVTLKTGRVDYIDSAVIISSVSSLLPCSQSHTADDDSLICYDVDRIGHDKPFCAKAITIIDKFKTPERYR